MADNAHASPEAVDAVVAEIAASGGQTLGVSADVTDRTAVDRMVAKVSDAWGRLDILVYAAGLDLGGPFREMKPEASRRVLEVN